MKTAILFLILTFAASAQTAANITVLSGNGQLICSLCMNNEGARYQPIAVKVTDSNGQPVFGRAVKWALDRSVMDTLAFATTWTDAAGIASNQVWESATVGNLVNSFTQIHVVATVDNATALFTLSQNLIDLERGIFHLTEVRLDGTTPVQVHVQGWDGTPLAGVSMRLTGSASCPTGPGADPGSVLTDDHGNASCSPVFAGDSGQYTVLVGSVGTVPGQDLQTYYQSPPISFAAPVVVPVIPPVVIPPVVPPVTVPAMVGTRRAADAPSIDGLAVGSITTWQKGSTQTPFGTLWFWECVLSTDR